MVIKFLMLGMIVVICSALGNLKAKEFENRYQELKRFKRGLGIFKSKLEFTYEPVGEIFKDISKLVYEGEENVFENYVENTNWNLAVDCQRNFLNDDKEVVKGLGKMLGKLDKSGQLNEICLIDGFVDKQIENAFENKEKNEKLYKVLGRSIGIAIAIILV